MATVVELAGVRATWRAGSWVASDPVVSDLLNDGERDRVEFGLGYDPDPAAAAAEFARETLGAVIVSIDPSIPGVRGRVY